MHNPLSVGRFFHITASTIVAVAAASLVCALNPVPMLAATITYVQGNYATPQTSQTSVPVTFTAAQAAGDLNVVAVGWNDSTATVSSVTDKSGNTYTRAVGPTIQTGVASQSIYYAKNIVAAAAGANIVTVTFSSAAVSPDVRILEYKGADPNNPVDVTAANSGSSATSSSGAATTTNATDLIFGANLVQTETTGPGSGFTSRLLTSPDGDIAEDEMVTATGSYSATAPLQSGQWIMQMVAFRTAVPPTVTSVSPNTGVAAGGTPVTITGTNFATGATVTFGTAAATNVVVVSSTSITATTPAGSVGAVTVTVTVAGNSGSLASGFTYTGTPTVTSVSPNVGSTAGGTAVTITGTNFITGATVTFGTTAATNVVVVSSTSITATTPAGSVGAVTVTVTNPGALSGSLPSGFTYSAIPAVTSVSPNFGSTAGGTAVTITGANFAIGATTVTFGATAATNVVVQNATTLTATTPAGSVGAVTVTVTVSGMSGSLTNGFTYTATPTVTSVSPNNGLPAGGTAVTITGTNFATGATVTFGTTAATNVVVVNSTSITATTPAGSGAVTVTVTNPGALSGSLANGFTYANATSITYVQSNSADPQTSPTSVTVTFTAAQAAGDLNVVVVGWNNSTATVSTVTDKSGNTYALAVGPTVQSGVESQSIYYAKNIVAAAAGANIVTVTFSSAAAYPDIRILEYKGADLNDPVDVTAANSGSSATSSSGAATTTNATDLIFGANMVQTETTGPGSGFTSRVLTSPDGDIAEDETVTATGSYSATAPLQSGQWIMQMVAFRTPSVVTTVTSISPTFGSMLGGTPVTITGTNFAAGATVTFGTAAATNVVVVNSTTITATTPAGSVGVVTVTVTVAGNSGSLASGFTYTGSPTVTGVSPNVGSTAGGTAVTITGTNFATGATVTFGTTAATNVVVVSSTSITATTPAGSGAVTVTVTNPGTLSGSLTNGFTYAAIPAVTSVSPNFGSTAGGTAVTITGANFVTGATVTFGGNAATNIVVANGTTITATTPAGNAGAVTVTVTVSGMSGSLTSGFTYVATPTVTSVSPNSGSTGGGTAVTITGTNFATGATVTFGAAAATNVVVVNSTTITAATPAGSAGAVTVTVTNLGALSGSLANGFTYANATSITYVQSNSADPQTSPTSVAVTFTAAQAAGDLNVVVVGWNNSTSTVSSVTDKSGNTYALAVGPTVQSGVQSQSIYYAKNILAAAAGANVVTVTFSSAAAFPDIRILEYKGADPNNPVDVTAASSGSSATSSSGSATTTNATDLIFGANMVQTETTGPGSGFTQRVLTSPDGDIAEDKTVTATGSYSATAPLQSGQWIMQMVALRTTDTTPPTAPSNLTATPISASQINLSWTGSTDNIGVTGYLVERCTGGGCTSFAQIGTSTTTTYMDATLAPNTSYTYRVRATDADGNLSAYSNTVTAITLSALPTAPTLSVSGGGAAPVVIGQSEYYTDNFLSTHTLAGLPLTGADAIVLAASSHQGVTFTVTDSFNNTWIPIAGPTSTTVGTDLRTELWYVRNPTTGPFNDNIVINLSEEEPLVMSVVEVQGSNISSPIDAVSLIGTDNGSQSTTMTSPSLTTSGSNELLLGFSKGSTLETYTAGPGFTLLTGASSDDLEAVSEVTPTPGSYTATILASAPQTWEALAVALGNNPSQTTLSWTPSTEAGGTISSYLVERCAGAGCNNFVQIGTTTAPITTYNDPGLTAGASYSYQVQAVDALNNVGPASATVTIVLPAPLPSLPGDLTAAEDSVNHGQIDLAWTASLETGGTISSYNVQRCAGSGCTTGFATIGTSNTTTYSDPAPGAGSFTYRVQAVDATGHVSPFSNSAIGTTPPTQPLNLTATPSGVISQIALNWTASTDNNTVSYVVERCQGVSCSSFAQIGTATGTTYTDTLLPTNTSFSYEVQPTDAYGNLGPVSNIATATTPNLPVPTAPTLSVMDGGAAPIIVGEAQYFNETSQTTHTLSGLPLTGADAIVLAASSHNGVTFTLSDSFDNTWIPIAGPTSTTTGSDLRTELWYVRNPVTGPFNDTITMNLSQSLPLVISVVEVKGSDISSPIDAVSLIGSDNGTQSTSVVSPSLTTSGNNELLLGFSKFSATGTYTATGNFTLLAGASNNDIEAESGLAASPGVYEAMFNVTTPQTWQAVAVALGNNPNQTTLSWTPSTEVGGSISSYIVQRCQGAGCNNFVQIGTTTAPTTTYNDTGLTASTSYTYRVQAEDAVDTLGPFSSPVTIVIPGPLPSLPGNLTATPASGTQINLAWTASLETGGTIANYVVQRCLADAGTNSTGYPCSTGFQTIMTVSGSTTAYSDTQLNGGGVFNYRVQAIDANSVASPFSNTATASVPDTQPPSTPTNLQALASPTVSQISLSWGASTDNVGVTGYVVERCQGSSCNNFVQIGTSATTTYTDMGLFPSTTYSYCVSATDAAGNLSPCSTPPAMATTPSSAGPSAPGTLSAQLGSSSGPTVVAVQNLEDSSATTSHTSAAFNSTGGNLILLYAYTLPGVTITPSDNLNNVWIPIAGPTTTTSGGNLLTELWYAWNPIVGPGHTITITLATTGEPLLMSILVLQNADASSPIDAVSLIGSNSGSSTVTSPSITTTGTNDLLTGFAATSAGVTFTPGMGFTLQAGASDNVLAAETGPAATPGSYFATFTLNGSAAWQSAIVAAVDNPNQATVSWSPASDAGSILNYFVSRCQGAMCSNYAQVGTVAAPATTFIDTGLTASTSYTYQVQAEDSTFTVGPFSNTASVVTPAPTPSLPGNLTVTTSGTTNTLSWIASQELGGTVSSYVVQSCQGVGCANFVTITAPTVTGISYMDQNVNPSTSYTYRVQAVDALNNLSPFSNVATVVTAAAP